MQLSLEQKQNFQDFIWDFYKKNKRQMIWRDEITPYNIVVSEIMLQQTQVPRVMQKYIEWMNIFPDFKSLAQADLVDVLKAWQGMGYNRRGKYLQQIAQKVVNEYKENLPDDPKILETFPGLGHATANSIVAFAFNKPVVFIETNIRRVYIHHFFQDKEGVHDKEIFTLVAETVDQKNPREWYYALMDYGTMLAKIVKNPNRKSKHYVKQSKFEGSKRQIRGELLRQVLDKNIITISQISEIFPERLAQIKEVFQDIEKEGFLVEDKSNGTYSIKKMSIS